MSDLFDYTNDLLKQSMLKQASKTISAADALVCLKHAEVLARRVEASKTVTGGFFSDSILSTIESFLNIAVPFSSMSSDYELTSLLSALRVWVNKKKNEAEMEKMQAAANSYSSGSFGDLNFSYTF